MEAGWDPFGDPADDSERSFVKAACKSVVTVDADLSEGHVPLDPWNDVTFVSLVQEAAREAKEQEEATLKLLAEQQEEEEQKQIEREARRLKLEQQARELAKLSLPERRQKLREREAYTEFAMEAIQQAPAFVAAAAERKSRSRELEVPQPDDPEVALGRAAAEIAAANMGVKINFKTKAEAHALGHVPSNCSRHPFVAALSCRGNLPHGAAVPRPEFQEPQDVERLAGAVCCEKQNRQSAAFVCLSGVCGSTSPPGNSTGTSGFRPARRARLPRLLRAPARP